MDEPGLGTSKQRPGRSSPSPRPQSIDFTNIKALQKSSFKTEIARQLQEKVWPLIEAGSIKPLLSKTFPLAQAADAHRLMESATHIGKIILETA